MADDGSGPASLSASERPAFGTTPNPLSVVDLFAGCGGLTLGTAQAAIECGRGIDVRLAVEIEKSAADIYRANFPETQNIAVEDIAEIFSPELVGPPTDREIETKEAVGELDILVGGPPCQGHSNLNNHTRRDDPKNALYVTMARAAHILTPDMVIIENVPAVLNDKFQGLNAVAVVRKALEQLNYQVADKVISLNELGVPQRRKRHIMLATRSPALTASDILASLSNTNFSDLVDLQWAIGDLTTNENLFDRAPKASPANLRRMEYLLKENVYDLPNHLRPKCHQTEHSYKSMYGRLAWDQPAQTITSGFGSIGQGRYMHPDEPRALTPHEAARIQGFPDYFDFSGATTRSSLATMIGNAVPPQLTRRIVLEYLGSPAASTE